MYLSDCSVPDEHVPPIPQHLTTVGIPYNPAEVDQYKTRLVEAIAEKVSKAQTGYDRRHPMLLSVFVNEYRAIYLDTVEEWERLVRENEAVFDGCSPFAEIVFWSLPNDLVFSVRPGTGSNPRFDPLRRSESARSPGGERVARCKGLQSMILGFAIDGCNP